jgi:iron(III) transport system permease protein
MATEDKTRRRTLVRRRTTRYTHPSFHGDSSVTTLTPVQPAALPPATPRSRSRRWRQSLLTPQGAILATTILIVAFLALVPIVYLLQGTLFRDGAFTLAFFREAYGTEGLGRMIYNSFVYAIGSTIVALISGTTLAYLVARTDVPMKGLVYAAALVPMIIPGVLHTIAWIFLGSPQIGVLNAMLEPVFGPGLFNIFGMWGMIFVEGIHNAPIIFLLMFAAFRNMDSSLEESALMSGASMPSVIRKITLPLVKPALLLSTIIMMIRALASFEVPALLGTSAGIWVFTSRIYYSLTGFPANYGVAGAYAIGLLAVLAGFAVMQARMGKKSKSYQTVSGKGFRPTMVKLGSVRAAAAGFVILYFLVTSLLPLAVLVYTSFLGYYSPPSMAALSSFTLENYRALLDDDRVITAFRNSFTLAISAATIIMFLTSMIAWIVVRSKVRGAGLLNMLTMIPIGVPGLIMGVALLFTYLRVPLPIYGTLLILLIAYITVFMPYGITYASSAMYQISNELEESAKVGGASWWTTFRRITLPLLMPGLVAGWTFIVLVAVRELGASLLLYTPGQQVLSILIWEEWGEGELVHLAALGVVMITLLTLLVVVARKLGAKVGVQSS